MKTVEEILYALECREKSVGCCETCAYEFEDCGDGLYADAAKLIRQLTDENRALRTELAANSKRKATSDMVNHPPHYESGKYECIEVMEEVYGTEIVKNFCLCNAFKYLYRCMHKHDSPTEDTKKSAWYLEKYFELGDRSNDD